MQSLRFRDRGKRRQKTLLLVTLGALTGIALAVALSDRGRRARRRRSAPLDTGEREKLIDATSSDDSPYKTTDAVGDVLEDDDEFGDEPPGSTAQPMAPGDEELEDRVLEAFHNDPTLRGRAIDIGAIGDGIIELTGWVHSAAEVGYAITLARGVPDVAHVMDSLTIRTPEHARARKPSADH